MISRQSTDLLILGGGCAGLSLACELARLDYPGQVIILESRSEYRNDRSWSFWSGADEAVSKLAAASWPLWRFSSSVGEEVVHGVDSIQYRYVPSDRFYDYAQEILARNPRFELRMASPVERVKIADQRIRVSSGGKNYTARYAVDCRPPNRKQVENSTLFQCFAGKIVRLVDSHALTTDTVELMTNMRTDARGFIFDYVLPLTSDRVFIEATRFSSTVQDQDAMKTDLEALITRRRLQPIEVEHEEYAVLPMGLPLRRPAKGSSPLAIAGTSSGALRPATGYAFLRIQHWAHACADRIQRGSAPCPHTEDPLIQRWMDALFLRVVRNHPERVPELFMALAAKTRPDVLIRFLSDQASLADRIRVVNSLPFRPFLKELVRL